MSANAVIYQGRQRRWCNFFSLNEGTLIIFFFFEVFVLFCFVFHHRFVPSPVAARFGELIRGEDSFVCLHLLEK